MIYDLLIVGGGVNGCAIARDAAGRGLRVLLVEQTDLAAATSSASTKLIHGGLRYLEQYEFRLVHEALAERELLLAAAPHIIRPLQFILPHEPSVRPAWLVRLGLYLYDHLARRKRIPGSRAVTLAGSAFGAPLAGAYRLGFSYYDCRVDDTRLVVLEAIDARERGAELRIGAKLVGARRDGDVWRASISGADGRIESVGARALVNASGPWVQETLTQRLDLRSTKHVRLVKGSHIVTRRLYAGDHAYLLQRPDKRIVFAIPFETDFTLIGTTDVPFSGAPGPVAIDAEETDYLLDSIRHFFRVEIGRGDVVWSYSGLRPLFDDGALKASVVTRDYAFDLARAEGAPALSVFGGKITTARRLAEHALETLAPFFPRLGPAWTAQATLPGGDLGPGGFDAFLAEVTRAKPFLPPSLARRLAGAYGTRLWRFLEQARSMDDLGEDHGCGLTEAELAFLRAEEWARSAEDVLWRRSKLGLRLDGAQQARLGRCF
ncbi:MULTISPECIES: glycerol-3-phosphate dehydrogenase [Methylosinus]|uniref:Glycerol-3-phosphate dehydrogenase n=1 Tax=Methylosinus trichosporium (strain ATCC 35070 / NCIMB 11131 / UNIQEM 75 / OB3b) TaxID=595536 RepID=A0A2D2D043_METT3|nr:MULTISPECIES: glycerol-3-phosphate dehydrogenase [Methylosinus]ATQ68336.1 glycerol-3-phosphate dehydrogenase [Methylosinus trichosporium OB3b]OBS50925.1 glycerol-3-phosphate dehydrogenase [Methylosinus sp. 3S-1]